MKRAISFFLLFTAVFAAAVMCFDIACIRASKSRVTSRNIAVNRINTELIGLTAETGSSPEEVIAEHTDEWKARFGKDMPEEIVFVPVEGEGERFITTADKNCAVCRVYDSEGRLTGITEYVYSSVAARRIMIVGNVFFAVVFLITAGVFIYICAAILIPFRKLSDYPERLARLRDIQKLPESRSRFFGKYVWGMNMLSDVLASESRKIHMLEGERQKLVSTIAHGVKTPIANIKLYTEAVREGLYSDGGMTEDIVDKMERNAAKVEKLAAELLASSDASLDGFDTEISRFPVTELAELIRSEYADRMAIKRIPFTVECNTDTVMESDKYALYRAVSQILENAVKYGDGSGIKVEIMRYDEGFGISVRDRGGLLPENEIPYVFRSYWRGSNAANAEGSGIGLYSVHETMRALGGNVLARRLEETNEMEFFIYIEDSTIQGR